jgi:hypothetical protein
MTINLIALRQIAAITVLAAAIVCLYERVTSVVMAVAHSKEGLLMLERTIPPNCYLPLQKTEGLPTIAAHIQRAQNAGHPMLLTYVGPGNPIRNDNRDLACTAAIKRSYAPLSCDEYPYASTFQGGFGASTAPVDVGENRAQGTLLSSFYRRFQPYFMRPMMIFDYFAALAFP